MEASQQGNIMPAHTLTISDMLVKPREVPWCRALDSSYWTWLPQSLPGLICEIGAIVHFISSILITSHSPFTKWPIQIWCFLTKIICVRCYFIPLARNFTIHNSPLYIGFQCISVNMHLLSNFSYTFIYNISLVIYIIFHYKPKYLFFTLCFTLVVINSYIFFNIVREVNT